MCFYTVTTDKNQFRKIFIYSILSLENCLDNSSKVCLSKKNSKQKIDKIYVLKKISLKII